MSLIVEDGTGKTDAESYASVAAADASIFLSGNTAWAAASTATKELHLKLVAQYLQNHISWAGQKKTSVQALYWPATGVYLDGFLLSSTAVPQRVINANIMLAAKSLAGELVSDLGADIITEQTVDVITIKYSPGKRNAGQKLYADVIAMIAPLTNGSGSRILLG